MIHFKVELKLSGYQLPAVITPAWQGQNRHNHTALPIFTQPPRRDEIQSSVHSSTLHSWFFCVCPCSCTQCMIWTVTDELVVGDPIKAEVKE